MGEEEDSAAAGTARATTAGITTIVEVLRASYPLIGIEGGAPVLKEAKGSKNQTGKE